VNLSFTIDPQGVETRVINDLVDFDGLRVLEVGCGDGRMTWRFAEKASSVLAVDVNDEKIEAAKWATSDHWRSKVRFEVCDITQTRLADDSFDAAVLSYSL
jgi:ubiquinone/menaquinone biosynthesis C-methylase UbiE